MSREKDMTRGNPTGLIFRFALPLMIGNIGQQLYTIVDAMIVGQGVGTQALAALGATDWTYWFFLWALQSFAQGFSILITQNFGAGDRPALRKSVAMSTLLCAGIGGLFTLVSLLLCRPLLTLLGTPADVLNQAVSYLSTLFAGTLVVLFYNLAASVLRAFGDGKTPLIAMIVASLINIGLDVWFVLGLSWGIVGAAVATVIAQGCALTYCLLVLRKSPVLRFERADWRPDPPVVRRLLALGSPLALQHALIAVGGMILQSVINGFGVVFLAGFTATNKLYGLLESSAISFGYAAQTYMGQNFGARRFDRLSKGIRSTVRLCLVMSVTISVCTILFGRSLVSLFVSASDASAVEIVDIAYRYLVIMSSLLFTLYLLHAYRSALQGLGNTTASLISGIIEFAMRVGCALLLPRLLGSTGVFFAEPAAWIGAAAFLMYSYYGEVRRIRQREGSSAFSQEAP